MNTIALAIGHNFAKGDRGASSNGTTEADTTKKIIDALILQGIPGFKLVKVPEQLDIPARNKWVNDRQKDIQAYIELHLDSASPTATGCTTFFVTGNNWAQGEAVQFQQAYTAITGLKGRGVHGDTEDRWGRLGAIRDIKVFGLLVELGFISNVIDLAIIKKSALAGITAGIKAMFAS